MLQVRVGKRSPQAALRIAVDMAEDAAFPLTRAEAVERVRPLLADPPTTTSARSSFVLPLVTGLPASPGMASGAIVTSPEAAQAAAASGPAAILVRAETSPDDVHGMAAAAGILTSRGGLASHAAVVARGWGIPAVVGATGIAVSDDRVVIGDRILVPGDVITIDGRTGEVFDGVIPGTTEVVPEARTLLAWAAELGIDVGAPSALAEPTTDASPVETSAAVAASSPTRKVTPDMCLRVIAIKGFAMLPGIADAVLADPSEVEPILDQLAIDGLVVELGGRPEADRCRRRAGRRAPRRADRAAWGEAAANAALDAFLDARPPGQGHGHRVAAPRRRRRHRSTTTPTPPTTPASSNDWPPSTPMPRPGSRAAAAGPPRLADYRTRLSMAVERARAGDGRYVASPRVDSYHGIWFELHEDLIALAGRTRAAEVEAGRA